MFKNPILKIIILIATVLSLYIREASAMKQIEPRDNKVLINFTHNGTWQTTTLTPILNFSGSTKLVTIMVVSSSDRKVGIRPTGTTFGDNMTRWRTEPTDNYYIVTMMLNASNQIDLYAEDNTAQFYLIAEMGGAGVVAFSDLKVPNAGPQANVWKDEDGTSYFGANAGNVSAVMTFNRGQASVRGNGSTFDPILSRRAVNSTSVAPVDNNDIFEIKEIAPGSALGGREVDTVYLVGYFLKGNFSDGGSQYSYTAPLNPSINKLRSPTAFKNYDVSAITGNNARVIHWQIMHTWPDSANPTYVRSTTSTDTALTQSQNSQILLTFPVKVDITSQVSYQLPTDPNFPYYITGYLTETPPACMTSSTISSHITTNTRLCLSNSPYTVTADILVYQGAKLIIEPGVVVKFNPGSGLNVGNASNSMGSLMAKGTTANPIIFTSNAPSPAAGDWDHISLSAYTDASQTIIENVSVEYSGFSGFEALEVNVPITIKNSVFKNTDGNGIWVNGSSPTITNNTFFGNTSYAVRINGTSAAPILRDNTYGATTGPGGILSNDHVISSRTLTKDNTFYVILSQKLIYNNSLLTIEPGVTVKFGANSGLTLGNGTTSTGALDARGTASEPIIFTSNAASPTAGSWNNINFDFANASQTFLDHVVVEYGGSDYNEAFDVNVPITITNSIFRNNDGNGIYVNNSSPTITNNTFSGNTSYAVRINGNSAAAVLRNNTYGATTGPSGILVEGNVQNSRTFTKDNTFYVILNQKLIYNNSLLTIEPGVTVKFGANSGLTLGNGTTSTGALDARGTTSEPIIFTSNAASPTAGSWNNINFDFTNASQTFLDHAVVEYGGSDYNEAFDVNVPITITNSIFRNNDGNGIFVNNSSPTITNNTFSGNTSYPVRINGNNASPVLRNNTYVGTGPSGILVNDNVSSSRTLTKDNTFYVILNQKLIYNNSKLTVDPGVTVKFGANSGLTIGNGSTSTGALDARGTANEPIVFTSNAASPTAGSWNNIDFNWTNASQTFVDHAVVEYGGSDYSEAFDVNVPITITNSIFRNNDGNGIFVNNSSPTITNNTFVGNTSYAVRINGTTAAPVLRNNTYGANGASGILFNDSVQNSRTLTKDNTFYLILNYKLIYNNSILTIEPGVTIKFGPDAGFNLGNGINSTGALDARGTATQPILFTSNAASPTQGSWNGIYFGYNTAPQSFFDHAVIEYAGDNYNGSSVEIISPVTITNSTFRNNLGNGIYVSQSAPVITNNTFSSNSSYAIRMSPNSSPVLTDNIYGANGAEGILIDNGTVTGLTTISKANIFYVVNSYLGVTGKLTIKPGVTMKFGDNASLTIGNGGTIPGALDAQGTAAEPIVFTSNSASPTPGIWYGVVIYNNATSHNTFIDNIVVEYGGKGADEGFTMVAPVLVKNSTFRYNDGYGLYALYSVSAASSNNFVGNTTGGMNAYPLTNVIHAENNWWGHASGPSGIGPGTGQAVNGNVEYAPWRGEAVDPAFTFYDFSVSPKKFNQNGGSTRIAVKITEPAQWDITIRNSTDNIVKTFSGSDTVINQDWLGDDSTSTPLPNGVYKYIISAVSEENPENIITLVGGKLTLDNTSLVAKITVPQINTIVANQVQIYGTASGTGFASYVLEYGQGHSPLTWTPISTSTSPVTNGLLGTWTVPEVNAPAGRIRLRVINTTATTFTDEIPIRSMALYSVADTPDPFSPNADSTKDTTTISAGITYSSNWEMTIKSIGGTVVRIFTGTGSNFSKVWDGKDELGVTLPDGAYTYQIQADDPVSGISSLSYPQTITIDNTLPNAAITAPTSGSIVSVVDVIGTASDTHFLSYQLQYGLGTSPTAWTTIVNSTTPVTSGVLGTFNPLHLPNGQNIVLRLIVNDQVGNIKTITVPIQAENVLITNVSSSPQFINPSLGQTSTLTYTLDRAANVTIELYRTFVTIGGGGDGVFGREYIGNLITNALKTAGVNTLVWDGKYLGATVNHSAYTYVIKASVGAKIGLYDPAYVAGSSSLSSLSLVPSNYNAYANEPVLINYTLNTP
ncbi:MAG: right-handed parallel beta-helix repeat-containing protein, partial [Candidatus Omnitrophica bacterium]|nr:right-handed parallel beta-helix repeat-containing protein [Candidatus Omnitrophota bacterium]